MTAISELRIAPTHSTRLPAIVSGAILCVVVWLVAWAIWNGPAAQAALQQARSAEIADESTAICQKWGMLAGSAKHAECMADLNAVRRRHEERITQDIGIL
jgi:hypothetical protein